MNREKLFPESKRLNVLAIEALVSDARISGKRRNMRSQKLRRASSLRSLLTRGSGLGGRSSSTRSMANSSSNSDESVPPGVARTPRCLRISNSNSAVIAANSAATDSASANVAAAAASQHHYNLDTGDFHRRGSHRRMQNRQLQQQLQQQQQEQNNRKQAARINAHLRNRSRSNSPPPRTAAAAASVASAGGNASAGYDVPTDLYEILRQERRGGLRRQVSASRISNNTRPPASSSSFSLKPAPPKPAPPKPVPATPTPNDNADDHEDALQNQDHISPTGVMDIHEEMAAMTMTDTSSKASTKSSKKKKTKRKLLKESPSTIQYQELNNYTENYNDTMPPPSAARIPTNDRISNFSSGSIQQDQHIGRERHSFVGRHR